MSSFCDNVMQAYDLIKRMASNDMLNKVERAAETLVNAIRSGGTIYVVGNGGSAADASHFAGELLGRFKLERKGLPCIALTTDMATITAIANDYGVDKIFERQLHALFDPIKDILITMSTSGNSVNILNSLYYIEKIKGKAINLIGKDGGTTLVMYPENYNIIIPSQDTARIQEMHMMILHYFAEHVENELNG